LGGVVPGKSSAALSDQLEKEEYEKPGSGIPPNSAGMLFSGFFTFIPIRRRRRRSR
jgi:hypothetical protein